MRWTYKVNLETKPLYRIRVYDLLGTDFEVGVVASTESLAMAWAELTYPGFMYECKGKIFRYLIHPEYGTIN